MLDTRNAETVGPVFALRKLTTPEEDRHGYNELIAGIESGSESHMSQRNRHSYPSQVVQQSVPGKGNS